MHPFLKPFALLLGLGLVVTGCRERVTAAQCEALVTRYAELVVRDSMPQAPQDVVRQAQQRVRQEAAGDENFHNCTTEIGPEEFGCAMAATTPIAVEQCLE